MNVVRTCLGYTLLLGYWFGIPFLTCLAVEWVGRTYSYDWGFSLGLFMFVLWVLGFVYAEEVSRVEP